MLAFEQKKNQKPGSSDLTSSANASRVDRQSPATASTLSFDFSRIPVRSPQCVDGKWVFERDGCSLPGIVALVYGVDSDNPAGGKDTQFAIRKPCAEGGKACDCHDECYQTYGADKDKCDSTMKEKMIETCQASQEPNAVKTECYRWAYRYYSYGLKTVFAKQTFKKRQAEVRKCQETTEGNEPQR
jgi:hypothetical protein